MSEKQLWDETAAMLGNSCVSWGDHWSFNFRNDPKRLGFVLSRYKFAAKMAGRGRVLELGCSSGIGASILGERAESYLGIDLEREEVEVARAAFKDKKFAFVHEDFLGKEFGTFDSVVSLDVVEHVLPAYETLYFETVIRNLDENGVCVIGTPNESAAAYASEQSKLGHVNLYSQERLMDTLKKYFHQVFPFGMNDEVMHVGYGPMVHYLLCVGCHKIC